jgi:hypothetical protein
MSGADADMDRAAIVAFGRSCQDDAGVRDTAGTPAAGEANGMDTALIATKG